METVVYNRFASDAQLFDLPTTVQQQIIKQSAVHLYLSLWKIAQPELVVFTNLATVCSLWRALMSAKQLMRPVRYYCANKLVLLQSVGSIVYSIKAY